MAWIGTVTCNASGSGNLPIPFYKGSRLYAVNLASSLTFSVDNLKMWTGEATSTTTHALDNLTQLDDEGATVESSINFATVYAVWVENVSTLTTTLVTVGNAAATQFYGSGGFTAATDTISMLPGDGRWVFVNKNGQATSGREDLKVTLSAAGKYRIVVFGTV